MKLGRHSPKLLLALVLAGVILPAESAHAGAQEDQFNQGTALFTDGKLEEALAIFRELWKTSKSYDVAAMLARTERNLDKFRDAAEHYSYAIANIPISGEEELREELRAELAEVKKSIGTVRIRVPVKDPVVKLDEKPIEAAMLGQDIFLAPGKAVIEATAAGYQPTRRTLEIKAGQDEDITITLKTEAPAKKNIIPVFVLGGVGVVGIVAGAALIGTAEGKKGEALMLHDEIGSVEGCIADAAKCQALRDATTQADSLGNGGIAMFVFGGLAGAAAAGYWLFPSRQSASSKVAILPVVSPTTYGAMVSGAF